MCGNVVPTRSLPTTPLILTLLYCYAPPVVDDD